MLITLWRGGYITLDPRPPLIEESKVESEDQQNEQVDDKALQEPEEDPSPPVLTLDLGQRRPEPEPAPAKKVDVKKKKQSEEEDETPPWKPETATPTEELADLLKLRGVHPLYALFLMKHLGIADRNERVMAFESLLELSRSIGPAIRIPKPDRLPPGPLQTTRLDSQLLKLGLATVDEFGYPDDEEDDDRPGHWDDDYVPVLTLPYKLMRLFQHDFPKVQDLRITPVWAAGEALNYGDDFNKYITSNNLQKQEGVVFRHLLRLVLLIDEMSSICPPDVTLEQWQDDLYEIADQLEEMCRKVDPVSTDQWLSDNRGDGGV